MRGAFNHVIWCGHQCLKALGVWGILGVVIFLVTAMMTYATIDSSAHIDAAYQPTSIAQLDKQTQAHTPTDTPKPAQSMHDAKMRTGELASLLTGIPEERRLPNLLNQIYQTAKLEQLTILKADYKWRKLKKTAAFTDGNIVQYEISFPVKGSYTAIRNMLNKVLTQIPMLAIDSLELNRENVNSTLTEAKVTFVVFLIDGNE